MTETLRLSHMGHRLAKFCLDRRPVDRWSPLEHAVVQLLEDTCREGQPGDEVLAAAGLVETTELDAAAVRLRYRQNPLENVRRVVFEYTTACGMGCAHCRCARLAPVTESAPEALVDFAALVLPLGIARFDFIGGEVLRFGDGWLEVARGVVHRGAETVAVLTSGWFLGQQELLAAGRRYDNERQLLATLADHGVTHLVFSLDGEEASHDEGRRTPGLYRRIVDEGFDLARQAGLKPRVSLVLRDETPRRWIAELAARIYGEADAELLLADDTNYLSHLVDIGGARRQSAMTHGVAAVNPRDLRCKAFYRPCPTLRVRADGELATCPLTDAGNGYGNIHHQSPRTLLNRLDTSPIAQLHASGAIAAYRRLLPEGRVGGVDHLCTLRALLSSLARRLLDDGLLPLESAGDRDATDEAVDQLLDDERRSRAAAAHAEAVLEEAGFSAL